MPVKYKDGNTMLCFNDADDMAVINSGVLTTHDITTGSKEVGCDYTVHVQDRISPSSYQYPFTDSIAHNRFYFNNDVNSSLNVVTFGIDSYPVKSNLILLKSSVRSMDSLQYYFGSIRDHNKVFPQTRMKDEIRTPATAIPHSTSRKHF